jgi:hypothetical protein
MSVANIDIHCPGCGGKFPDIQGPTHRYMESSPGCWAAYGEVLAREYSDAVFRDVHRLGVDAYAVQHPGRPSPQSIQSVGVHLIRLHLFLEKGLANENANDAMLAAARWKREFVWLDPPPSRGAITVADVVATQTPAAHAAALHAWAQSAWQAWAPHHATIRAWAARAVPRSG